MTSSELAARPAPAVPALAPTPATTITAEDIIIPKLYVGNFMSEAVKRRRVNFGDVYLAQGSDDTDPQVLWEAGSSEPGVLVHVLHLKKGKSWTPGQSTPLQVWDFDDPDAHPDAWTTYQYTLCLPEVDPEMPAKMLLTKSGRPAAMRMNTVLGRNSAQGPAWINAFRMTSDIGKKDEKEWSFFVASMATADKKHIKAAGELFQLIAPGLAASQSTRRQSTPTGDEPSI